MKIGQRIPIATGSFQSGVGDCHGVSPLAETQFQYQDVGVNIEMTPTIHFDHDVTLKMKIDVSSVAGQQNISGVTEPIFAQHTSEQVIRLSEGEASILGGILEKQDQVSWTGIPGLSSIPLVKYLFGSKDHTITEDEIVFLVVPHIVRSQDLTPANLRPIDTGAGQSIELRRISVCRSCANHAAASPATSAGAPGRAAAGRRHRSGPERTSGGPGGVGAVECGGSDQSGHTGSQLPQLTAQPPGQLEFFARASARTGGGRAHLPGSRCDHRRDGYCVCSPAGAITIRRSCRWSMWETGIFSAATGNPWRWCIATMGRGPSFSMRRVRPERQA